MPYRRSAWLLALVVTLASTVAQAAPEVAGDTIDVELSAAETAWLAAHPVVRVGTQTDWAPFDFIDNNGRHAGVAADYLALIGEKTGLRFATSADRWSRQLDALEQRRLDLLPAAYYTDARALHATYSPPYFEATDYFFIHEDVQAKTLEDLYGKRVALPRGFAQGEVIAEHLPQIEIVEVDTFGDAVDAVLEGRAEILYDTYASLNYSLKRRGITSIVPFRSTGHIQRLPLHMLTRGDQAPLASIVRKGLNAISERERREIYDRWFAPPATVHPPPMLSDAERDWLQRQSVIRLGIESDWPPYDFTDAAGRPQGLSVDIARHVEQLLGVRFEIIPNLVWRETLAQAAAREIDVISGITATPEREQYLRFTQPYIAPPYILFSRKDGPVINDLGDLRGLTVAVENQYRAHELLRRDYPRIALHLVDTTAEALSAVSYGQADAYIGNQGTANWIAERLALTNLKIAHIPRQLGEARLRFGVRRDWPLLQSAIDKAIAAIPAVEILRIRRRWLGIGTEPTGLALSPAERQWLGMHRHIRVGADPDWLPYGTFDKNGGYQGIVAELLGLVQARLGVEFEIVPHVDGRGDVGRDIQLAVRPPDAAARAADLTSAPYLASPIVIVMRDDEGYIDGIEAIGRRRIALVDSQDYSAEIQRAYPELRMLTIDSVSAGLGLVSSGAADALLAPLAEASYQINDAGLSNVRITGPTRFATRFSFRVDDRLAPLVPLLDRALGSISPAERQRVLDNWGAQRFADRTDNRRIAIVILVASGLLLLLLAWNQYIRLQRERLRTSEQRYQSAMEAVSEAVWEWDLTTGQRHFSKGFFSRLGYRDEQIPTDNAQWQALIHPDDRAAFDAAIDSHIEGQDRGAKMLGLRYRVRDPDGEYVVVESRGRVVAWDAHGKPCMRRGTLRDITEQQQAIDALKRSRETLRRANKRFALAADAISLGVWERSMQDPDYLVFDPRMFEIYGMTPQARVPVADWLARVHRDDRTALEAANRQVLESGGDAHIDFRIHTEDGAIRHIYAGITAIADTDGGGPDRLIGVNWDITERKRSQEQFEKVLDALPVAVVIANDDGEIVFSNAQAAREIGGARSLVGHPTEAFYACTQQRGQVLAELQAKGEVRNKEVRYRMLSGETIETLLSVIPIHFNEQPALLAVVINMTERLAMEKQLLAAKRQAEQANRFKSRFLANMSHEIRTPMNALVGFGHLLNRTALTPRQQDYLGKIQISANTLLGLIDDILDFSKIEAGELRIERIDFDLDQVLDTIATLAGTRLAELPVEFLYDLDPALPTQLRGDPHRLTQILSNLVNNAIKFTERGNIVLRVRRIDDDRPLQLVFEVEDTGIGIAQDKVEDLFAPFVQADGSTTREYGGTGLGLSICRQLTERMGGTIEAHSRPGHGSRFTVRLPFGAASVARRSTGRPDTAGLRVLLVDDNDVARQILSDQLLSLGFRVDVAASGEAAVEQLKTDERRLDVLLLDWRMPGLDGVATVHAVRELELAHPPKIIMMTAYGREAMAAHPNLSQIDGFLVKPITPSQLLDSIAQSLDPTHAAMAATTLDDDANPAHWQLKGRVLLVEDNAINRQVARELLEQMGLQVSVCEGGRQALRAIAAEPPDLVLMDIQMPDMDGYETTREIRLMPAAMALPIIAMTAHAMAGEAERSLEAGMNGHITKPVDPMTLHRTLSAWLAPGDTTPSRVADGAPRHAAAADQNAVLAPIDTVQGVQRVGGNQALYAKLLRQFVEQYRGASAQLHTWLRDGAASTLEHHLHTLKGAAGNIGADQVRAIAAELETHVRAGRLDAVEAGLGRLADGLAGALEEARRCDDPAEPGESADHATPSADLVPQLRDFAALLDAGDANALGQLDALLAQPALAGAQPVLARLRQQVQNYEFTTARNTLDTLTEQLGLGDVLDGGA